MMASILASPIVGRIGRWGLAALAIGLFVLGLRGTAEWAGRQAERLKQAERANDATARMLEASGNRARTRGDLDDRLRDGSY